VLAYPRSTWRRVSLHFHVRSSFFFVGDEELRAEPLARSHGSSPQSTLQSENRGGEHGRRQMGGNKIMNRNEMSSRIKIYDTSGETGSDAEKIVFGLMLQHHTSTTAQRPMRPGQGTRVVCQHTCIVVDTVRDYAAEKQWPYRRQLTRLEGRITGNRRTQRYMRSYTKRKRE
jgi:hypothetical protein